MRARRPADKSFFIDKGSLIKPLCRQNLAFSSEFWRVPPHHIGIPSQKMGTQYLSVLKRRVPECFAFVKHGVPKCVF